MGEAVCRLEGNQEENMSKLSWKWVLVLICAVGLLSGASTALAGGKQIKWRMGLPYPPGTVFQEKYQFFCDSVAKMSNGRFQIELVNAGAGIGPMELLNAVKTGVIQMGNIYPPFHQGQIPFGVVEVGLPGGPANMGQLRALQLFGWDKILSKAYAKHNVHWLPTMGQLGTYMLTKKPIKSYDDFKKMKIRAVGAYGKLVRALGASPVVVSYAEVYTSLATNVIDGWAGSNLIEFYDAKAFEVAKYLYPIQVSGFQAAPIVINKAAWQGLPADMKAMIEAANVSYALNMRAHCINMESDALQAMLKSGVTWSPAPSADDKAKWAKAVEKVWAEFETGDPTSRELVKTQKEFMGRLIKP